MFRRVGAHRRWGAAGLSKILGRLWDWNPGENVQPGDLLACKLTGEEKHESLTKMLGHWARMHRLQLRCEDVCGALWCVHVYGMDARDLVVALR